MEIHRSAQIRTRNAFTYRAALKELLPARHPRDSGDPRRALDWRFRGNDRLILLFPGTAQEIHST